MGCDIHLHVEIKVNGEWHHYANPSVQPFYALFAKMAGVRNYDNITPITPPRGLPEDVTAVTRFDAEYWAEDAHSHSYLNAEEISELVQWIKTKPFTFGFNRVEVESYLFGYLFGNNFSEFTRYLKDRRHGLEDVRFVFWFDN
jgi:hypothetical protein